MVTVLFSREDPLFSGLLRSCPPPGGAGTLRKETCLSGADFTSLPAGSILIADSGSPLPEGAEKLRVVTCGRSQKDTFTFSSKGEESGSVALMRAVETPAGTVGPMELPVEFPPCAGDFDILAAAAVFILSGASAERISLFYPPETDSPNLNK